MVTTSPNTQDLIADEVLAGLSVGQLQALQLRVVETQQAKLVEPGAYGAFARHSLATGADWNTTWAAETPDPADKVSAGRHAGPTPVAPEAFYDTLPGVVDNLVTTRRVQDAMLASLTGIADRTYALDRDTMLGIPAGVNLFKTGKRWLADRFQVDTRQLSKFYARAALIAASPPSVAGLVTAPLLPAMAAAYAAGTVPSENMDRMTQIATQLYDFYSAVGLTRDNATEILQTMDGVFTQAAQRLTPQQLAQESVGWLHQIAHIVDPDGPPPEERLSKVNNALTTRIVNGKLHIHIVTDVVNLELIEALVLAGLNYKANQDRFRQNPDDPDDADEDQTGPSEDKPAPPQLMDLLRMMPGMTSTLLTTTRPTATPIRKLTRMLGRFRIQGLLADPPTVTSRPTMMCQRRSVFGGFISAWMMLWMIWKRLWKPRMGSRCHATMCAPWIRDRAATKPMMCFSRCSKLKANAPPAPRACRNINAPPRFCGPCWTMTPWSGSTTTDSIRVIICTPSINDHPVWLVSIWGHPRPWTRCRLSLMSTSHPIPLIRKLFWARIRCCAASGTLTHRMILAIQRAATHYRSPPQLVGIPLWPAVSKPDPSPQPQSSATYVTPTSSRQSSTKPASHCSWAEANDYSAMIKSWPLGCSAAAADRDVESHRSGLKATTASTGTNTAAPTPPTSSCYATPVTTTSTKASGLPPGTNTMCSTGSQLPGSTPPKPPSATPTGTKKGVGSAVDSGNPAIRAG